MHASKRLEGRIGPQQVWSKLIHYLILLFYIYSSRNKNKVGKPQTGFFADWFKYLLHVNTNYLSVENMSMMVTSFNIACCNKCRVFTHHAGWWNQLNTLGNTFSRKNVSIFKLRNNEIRLVFLWMLFMDQFSPLVMLSPCSLPSNIRKTICFGDEAVVSGNIQNILQNVLYTFAYSFCFTFYE